MSIESVGRDNTRGAPLRVHLSALIMALLVSVALPLIWLGYHEGEEEAAHAAAQRMRMLADRTAEHYRTVFDDAVSAVAMAAISEPFASAPPSDLAYKTEFFARALDQAEHIEGMFAGYSDGTFIQALSLAHNQAWQKALGAPQGARFALRVIAATATGQRSAQWRFVGIGEKTIGATNPTRAQYDPRDKLWYRAALAAAGPISRGPYVMPMSGKLGFAIAERHRNDPQAVIGADILVDAIRSFLIAERVSDNARSYLFDASGKLITQSNETAGELERIQRGKLPEFHARLAAPPDPVLSRIGALLKERDNAADPVKRFSHEGEKYVAHVSAIRFALLPEEQTLVIAAPLSDFTAASQRLLRRGLLASGALLLAGLLAALAVSRLITRSLQALTAKALHLGDLDFEETTEVRSRIKEINTLGHALGAARDAIRTFALYVPRELVRKIVASGQFAGRGASRQEVTVLFSDIKDFTTISERHSPESVVLGLSAYFDLMNREVEDNQGSIVQFLGDSIYAMWNAPVAEVDHAAHGCRCALDLAAAVRRFNAQRAQADLPEFVTRFGLHTGPAVVGSVGAEKRLQYTAMGDTVNVASRLEGINKEFGTTILVSGAVEASCRGRFAFRALGKRKAKGREEEIEIFELVDNVTAESSPAARTEQEISLPQRS